MNNTLKHVGKLAGIAVASVAGAVVADWLIPDPTNEDYQQFSNDSNNVNEEGVTVTKF